MDTALAAPSYEVKPGRLFRALIVTTIVAIFGLVVLGGVVRVTESGLGCPDWPLCHGRIIPPAEKEVLIEYSHRLVASVVSVLVLAVLVGGWRSYRDEPWIFYPAVAAFGILLLQIVLGGIVVITELPPEIVLAHLATAQALLATMILVYVVSRFGTPSLSSPGSRFPLLALFTGLATFGLLLSGSYLVGSGAETACGRSWPLCLGQVVPNAWGPLIHLLHRVISVGVGLMLVFTLWKAWRIRSVSPRIATVGAIAGAAFLIQIFVGAANVWLGYPLATKVLHLGMATATWGALVALVVISFVFISDRVRDVDVQRS